MTYQDAEAIFHEANQIQAHLKAQDDALGVLLDKVQALRGGGSKLIGADPGPGFDQEAAWRRRPSAAPSVRVAGHPVTPRSMAHPDPPPYHRGDSASAIARHHEEPLMAGITPVHLIIVLVIALLILGPGKLPETGAALGKAFRDFRHSMTDEVASTPPASPADITAADAAPPTNPPSSPV